MFGGVFCDGEAEPPPHVSWWHGGHLLTEEATLDFTEVVTREQAGEYLCQVSNPHGVSSVALNVNVVYKPTCKLNIKTAISFELKYKNVRMWEIC